MISRMSISIRNVSCIFRVRCVLSAMCWCCDDTHNTNSVTPLRRIAKNKELQSKKAINNTNI